MVVCVFLLVPDSLAELECLSVGSRYDESVPGLWTTNECGWLQDLEGIKISQGSAICESIEARMCISREVRTSHETESVETRPQREGKNQEVCKSGKGNSNRIEGRLTLRKRYLAGRTELNAWY